MTQSLQLGISNDYRAKNGAKISTARFIKQ